MHVDKKYKNLILLLEGIFNFIGAVLLTLVFLNYNPDIAFIAPLFFFGYFGKLSQNKFSFKKLKEEIKHISNLKQDTY